MSDEAKFNVVSCFPSLSSEVSNPNKGILFDHFRQLLKYIGCLPDTPRVTVSKKPNEVIEIFEFEC